MKKVIAAIVAAFVLALTVTVAAPAQATTTTQAPSLTTRDYQFLALLRDQEPDFIGVSSKLLVRTAKNACKLLRTYEYDVYDLVDATIDNGLTEDQAYALIAASVVVYCPSFAP